MPDNVGGRFGVFTRRGAAAGRGPRAGRAGPVARGGGDDQAVLRGAVRAQPGPAIRGRQLPAGRGARQTVAGAGRLVDQAGRARPVVRPAGRRVAQPARPRADPGRRASCRATCSARGQQLQDGPRTAVVNHLVVKSPKAAAVRRRHGGPQRGRPEPVRPADVPGLDPGDARRLATGTGRIGPADRRPGPADRDGSDDRAGDAAASCWPPWSRRS